MKQLSPHPGSAPRHLRSGLGFTLFEMIIALSMFVLLIAGIFSISQSTLELTESISLSQDRSLVRQNFIEFMRRSFRTLPGEAEVRLSVKQSGSSYVPTMNIANGGSSFTPGTSLAPDTSMDVYAEERPGGYLRVMLRVLDQKQTQAMRSNQAVRYTKDQITLPLLDNVSRFEWKFYDASTNRWENNWKQARRPILAEMNLQLDDGFESRSIFWLPPIVPNAANQITQNASNLNNGVNGNNGNSIDQDPNNPNPSPNNSPAPIQGGGGVPQQ